MADLITSLSSAIAGGSARVAASSSSAPKMQMESASTAVQIQHVSPSLRFDPIAGIVITEYFNSSGEVQAQLPSAASVAYLRSGLTATGAPPESTTEPVDTSKQQQKDMLA